MKDCVFLVADRAMEAVFQTFLARDGVFDQLVTRPFTFDLLQIPGETDPDLYARPDEILQEQLVTPETHRHAVVALDQQFNDGYPADEIREHAMEKLVDAGWVDRRAHVTVIEPELEVWMWHDAEGPMRVVEAAFSYNRAHRTIPLRNKLAEQNQWPLDLSKPASPKAAFDWSRGQYRGVDRRVIFCDIVKRVGISHCQDPAFRELREVLCRWFPPAWMTQLQ